MKKLIAIASVMIAVLSGWAQLPGFRFAGNPIVRDKFTSDPAPMVSNGRLYLFTGHDEAYDHSPGKYGYNLTEWLCYSTDDMLTWTDHGVIMRPQDFAWAEGEAWAAQCVEKDGKFYFFVSTQAREPWAGKAVGVAVSDSPTGPFTDLIGRPLISDGMTDNGARGWWNDIDPTVLLDDNGEAWLCWGNGTCFMAPLAPDFKSLAGEIRVVDVPNFVEGPWLHKRNGIYYLTYVSMDNGSESIDYATAPSPEGPWTHRGQLTDNAVNSFTIHPGIINFNGRDYFFYHNGALEIDGVKGGSGRRSVCVAPLEYLPDGSMKPVIQDSGITVEAPNGSFSVSLDAPACGFGTPVLSISRPADGAGMKDIQLGMQTADRSFNGNLRLAAVGAPVAIHEEYTMATGKRSHCTNDAEERLLTFVNPANDTLTVRLRAYNDGMVFRYELAATQADSALADLTTFRIPAGTDRWLQKYEPLSYEGFYPHSTESPAPGESCNVAFPALVQNAPDMFTLITESDLGRNQCGAYLTADGETYRLTLADGDTRAEGSWHSPWRVFICGTAADIVESTLVTDVATPAPEADFSWVEPAPAAWIYWAYNHGSKDYRIVTSFADLAAQMHWPYLLIDWEWNVMTNGGNLEDAVRYAASKGVKPLIWYNSSTAWTGESAPQPLYRLNAPESRNAEFDRLNGLGIYGVKVDFFDGDHASTMNYFFDILEDTARHKLLVTLHGATIPRGWQRTYPNLMTVEGVYGAEWYNNRPDLGPRAAEHNATLPFTRNVVGPMDYTPGTFSDTQHPHFTTHSHELALPLLFESAVQHMPDRPDIYLSMPQEVQQLLSSLPTAWDDTRLLSGYPGNHVVIARRKGTKWYIAGINGTDNQATLTFDTDRLNLPAGLKMTLFSDPAAPREFCISHPQPTSTMAVPCQPRGGFVAILEP